MKDSTQIYLCFVIIIIAIVVYLFFICLPPMDNIKDILLNMKKKNRNKINIDDIVSKLLIKYPNIKKDKLKSLLLKSLEEYKKVSKIEITNDTDALTIAQKYIEKNKITN